MPQRQAALPRGKPMAILFRKYIRSSRLRVLMHLGPAFRVFQPEISKTCNYL